MGSGVRCAAHLLGCYCSPSSSQAQFFLTLLDLLFTWSASGFESHLCSGFGHVFGKCRVLGTTKPRSRRVKEPANKERPVWSSPTVKAESADDSGILPGVQEEAHLIFLFGGWDGMWFSPVEGRGGACRRWRAVRQLENSVSHRLTQTLKLSLPVPLPTKVEGSAPA